MTTPTDPIADTPPDRDLIARILAAAPAVLDRVREIVSAAKRVPELEAALIEERRLRAGDQDSDAAADAVALEPVENAVDALRDLLWPAADAAPDVTPVADIRDVPAVVAGDLDPGDPTGRSDQPAADTGGTGQTEPSA